MDIGRVKDTWMEAKWGAEGRRYEVPIAVALESSGAARLVGVGAYAQLELADGTWRVDNRTFRMELPVVQRYERGDIWLEEGVPLNFSIGFFPEAERIAQRGGRLTIPATRFLIRREKRLVGTCVVSGPYDESEVLQNLPAARVRTGDHDGRVYESG